MSPKTIAFVSSSVIFLALDQASKAWVRANLAIRQEIPVIDGLLTITHARNKGAALSMLDDFEYRLWVFYAFTAVAVYVIVSGWRQLPDTDRVQALAMGFILSGALGNFIDRVAMGEVTDMVKVYAGFEPLRSWALETFSTNVYPIWNIADAGIFIGVGLFALSYVFGWDTHADNAATPPPAGPGLPGHSAAGE